jgi:hypothetical protein
MGINGHLATDPLETDDHAPSLLLPAATARPENREKMPSPTTPAAEARTPI